MAKRTETAFKACAVVVGVVGLVAFAATAAPIGAAQGVPIPNPAPQETGIVVAGEGIVLAQPNTARVTIGVEVTDASLANAQAESSRRMDAVVQKIKAAGVSDNDIRTISYTVNPQYDQQQSLKGYQVQNLVQVRTTDVNGLGQLLDATVSAGASRVYGIAFEADNMSALKDQARDQAMQNARAKAEQLARDAGVGLGRATLVEDTDTGGVTPIRAPQALAAPAAAQPAAPPPIQPGELQVRSTVRVVWAIQ